MRVIKLEETKSTNTYSKENLTLLEDKTVVHALRQTHGRGRLNRTWVDLGENNLFFSIVLKPSTDFKAVYSNLTQYASVILCKIFENCGFQTGAGATRTVTEPRIRRKQGRYRLSCQRMIFDCDVSC